METIIQLPSQIYQAVSREAGKRQITPDQLVTVWVSSHLTKEEPDEQEKIHQAFEKEAAAFTHLLPTLFDEYQGKFVAIHGEKAVASGDNRLLVWAAVRQQFGDDVVCYIEKVVTEPVPTARITSAWVSQP